MHKADRIPVLVGLRSCHADDRDGNISRTASDTATGHRFGDFAADGGMSFDQGSGHANGVDLVGLGVDDETAVKDIRRTRRISQEHAQRSGRAGFHRCEGQVPRPGLLQDLVGAPRSFRSDSLGIGG